VLMALVTTMAASPLLQMLHAAPSGTESASRGGIL
jgi:hypothetical protein